ncbi:hypothetical protein EDB85DRAFT_171468 [Lactarius pseudohatsudake]|nr:hypothetical protein EDB85DRAFT_171468 [Lactarius pseudohatsudake]
MLAVSECNRKRRLYLTLLFTAQMSSWECCAPPWVMDRVEAANFFSQLGHEIETEGVSLTEREREPMSCVMDALGTSRRFLCSPRSCSDGCLI